MSAQITLDHCSKSDQPNQAVVWKHLQHLLDALFHLLEIHELRV